jgi:GTP cyclohydrolase II
MGEVAGRGNVLCRVHSACIGGHVFNSVECTCAEEMAAAQKELQEAGVGVIVYLDQEGKGNGHLALLESIPHKKSGLSQSEAYIEAGFKADARDYRPAAEILHELGVTSVVLLTENAKKADELRCHSVTIAESRGLDHSDD